MFWNVRKLNNTAKALIILANDGIDFYKKLPNQKLQKKGEVEILIFNSSFIGMKLSTYNPILYNNTVVEYNHRLDKEIAKRYINTKSDKYPDFLNARLSEYTKCLKGFSDDPMYINKRLLIRFFKIPGEGYRPVEVKSSELLDFQLGVAYSLSFIDEELKAIIEYAESRL